MQQQYQAVAWPKSSLSSKSLCEDGTVGRNPPAASLQDSTFLRVPANRNIVKQD